MCVYDVCPCFCFLRHVHLRTRVCARARVCTCMFVVACVTLSLSAYLSVCLCLSVSASASASAFVPVSVCLSACLSVCVCVCACLCVFLSVVLSVCVSVCICVSVLCTQTCACDMHLPIHACSPDIVRLRGGTEMPRGRDEMPMRRTADGICEEGFGGVWGGPVLWRRVSSVAHINAEGAFKRIINHTLRRPVVLYLAYFFLCTNH